jgi:hypothetical protein
LGGWRPTPLALEIKATVGRFRWREKIEKNDDGDRNADQPYQKSSRDHSPFDIRMSGECRDKLKVRNSIEAETAAAPASADAYHPPDYPTTPQTMATTNRNAAVKIAPWSIV